jgi:recombination protein RecA
MKIGVMFGNPETTTGGNALKFYSSVRLDIRRIASIKDRDEIIGNRVKVKVAKNKVAAPFKVVEFDIYYDEGISRTGEILDISVEQNLVEKSGTWFSYQGERLGQGRENARGFLKEHREVLEDLEVKAREAMGLPPLSATALAGHGAKDAAPKAKPSADRAASGNGDTDADADADTAAAPANGRQRVKAKS